MDTKSPWSTPTESEILNAEDSALIKEKEDTLFEEIDYTVNASFGARELGDGEPSVDENIERKHKELPLSPTKSKSKKGLTNGIKEKGRRISRSKSPSVDKVQRQKSVSPTKKKRSPKNSKKKLKPTSMEDENLEPEMSNNVESDNEVHDNNERNKTATLSKEAAEEDFPEDIMAAEENYNVSPVKRSTSKDSPKKKPNKKKLIPKETAHDRRSPSPTKQLPKSPVKQLKPKANRKAPLGRTATASSGASGDSLMLGADYANMGEQDSGLRRTSRPTEAGRNGGRLTNGRGSDDATPYSANTNRSSSTATSGSTGAAVQARRPSPPISPKKSPTKSPKKLPKSPKKKLKDLLVLPMPYNDISSDEVKRWEKTLSNGEEIDEEIYPEFQQIE